VTEEKVRNAGAVMRSVDKLMIEGKHNPKNDFIKTSPVPETGKNQCLACLAVASGVGGYLVRSSWD
jgi:hypothetical protein